MFHLPHMHREVAKIAASYLVISFIWILASDKIMTMLIVDPVMISHASMVKGWFFVLITATLLYVQIYRYVCEIEKKETDLQDRNAELEHITQMLACQIKEMRVKEQQLSESEERFRRAVLYAPFPLMIHAEGGEIITISNVWSEITGYAHEDIPTVEDWLKKAHKHEHDSVKDSIDALYGISSRHEDGEYVICTRDGQVRNWVFSSAPLGMLQDGRKAVISMAADITCRKTMENELKEKNRELDQFAYVISHDLKAPLRGIFNLSQWIEEDLGEVMPDEVRANMDLLRKRVQRMQEMIQGLLEYSRVGRATGQISQCNVADLIKEIINDLNPPAHFQISWDDDMPVLMTDSLRLRQVFANLLDNAIKHHDKNKGHIKILVKEMGPYYQFSVSDDGPGIAKSFHNRIFELFQVLQPRDSKENTGVGLALVKKIIENQYGSITVESEVGCGTTIRFTWAKVMLLSNSSSQVC